MMICIPADVTGWSSWWKDFFLFFKCSVFASCSSAPIHHVSESQILPPWACCSEGGNHSVRPPVVALTEDETIKTLQPQLDLVSLFSLTFFMERLRSLTNCVCEKLTVLGRFFLYSKSVFGTFWMEETCLSLNHYSWAFIIKRPEHSLKHYDKYYTEHTLQEECNSLPLQGSHWKIMSKHWKHHQAKCFLMKSLPKCTYIFIQFN